jgi:hypothetical protein
MVPTALAAATAAAVGARARMLRARQTEGREVVEQESPTGKPGGPS